MYLKLTDKVKVISQNIKGIIVHIHQNQHMVEVKTTKGYQLSVPSHEVTKIKEK